MSWERFEGLDHSVIAHPDIHEILVFSNPQTTAQAIKAEIEDEVRKYPSGPWTWATGYTMYEVWNGLRKDVLADKVSFEKTFADHLDEYWPYAGRFGFVKELTKNVFDPLRIPVANRITINGMALDPFEEAKRYDEETSKQRWNLSLWRRFG